MRRLGRAQQRILVAARQRVPRMRSHRLAPRREEARSPLERVHSFLQVQVQRHTLVEAPRILVQGQREDNLQGRRMQQELALHLRSLAQGRRKPACQVQAQAPA